MVYGILIKELDFSTFLPHFVYFIALTLPDNLSIQNIFYYFNILYLQLFGVLV